MRRYFHVLPCQGQNAIRVDLGDFHEMERLGHAGVVGAFVSRDADCFWAVKAAQGMTSRHGASPAPLDHGHGICPATQVFGKKIDDSYFLISQVGGEGALECT